MTSWNCSAYTCFELDLVVSAILPARNYRRKVDSGSLRWPSASDEGIQENDGYDDVR